MAITLRTSNGYVEFNSGASATSHNVTLSDAAVGNVRFICANWSPDGTGTLPAHPTITGWTSIGTSTATGAASNSRLSMYYRVVQSGDTLTSATVNVSLANTAWAMCCAFTLEDVDGDSVLDQTTPTMATGSATTQPCPAITTTTDGAWVIHTAIQDGSGLIVDGDKPSSDTLLGTINGNPPSNGACIGVSYIEEATAGSSPSASWNSGTSEEYVAATFAVSPASDTIDTVTPDEFDMDATSVVIDGTNFAASGNDIYLSDVDTLAGGVNEVDISSAITAESTTQVTLDLTDLSASELASLHTLGPGQRYIIMDTGVDEFPSPVLTVHRPQAFVMSLSSNFAPGGTTAQLTAPSTKTTGDMDGGRIEEAANPSATTTDVTADDYREDEWCFTPQTNVREVAYSFRVTYGGTVPDTITVTPSLTVAGDVERTASASATGTVSVAYKTGIKVRVANFSLRTTNGTQDITLTGLGAAANIKGALFFCSGATTLDSTETAARFSIGSTDKTDVSVTSHWVEDGQTANDTRRYQGSTQVIRINDKTTETTVTTAAVDSWITNGVRLDVTNPNAEAYKGHVVFFVDDGTDLQVKLVRPQMTTTTNVDVTTVGFEPEAMFVHGIGAITLNAAVTDARHSYGMIHNDGGTDPQDQSCLLLDSDEATNPPAARTYLADARVAGRIINSALGFTIEGETFDASGFTLDPDTDGSTTYQHCLCITTGGKLNIWQGNFTGPTSAASDWSISAPGFTPQAVIAVQSAATTTNSLRSTDEISSCMYSFDKDGGIGCIGITEDNGVSPSNTTSWASSSNALWTVKDDQSGDFHLAATPSMTANGFEFPAAQITTADGTGRYGFALAFGVLATLSIVRTSIVVATGTVSATTSLEVSRVSTVSATAVIASSALKEIQRAASVAVIGTAVSIVNKEVPRSVTVASIGSVFISYQKTGTSTRSVTVDAAATATVSTLSERLRIASTLVLSSVSSSRYVEKPRISSCSAIGSVVVARTIERTRSSNITATGTVTAVAEAAGIISRNVTVSAIGSVSSAYFTERLRISTVSSVAGVLASRIIERNRLAAATATTVVSSSRFIYSINVRTLVVAAASSVSTTTVKYSVFNRTAAVSAVGLVSVAIEAAGVVSRSSTVSALGSVSVVAAGGALRSANVVANGNVLVDRHKEILKSSTVVARGFVSSINVFAFLRVSSSLGLASIYSNFFIDKARAETEIVVGNQMIAKSDDTAFPIEASISKGGGVSGLTVTVSLRDPENPVSYLDFDDLTMKAAGWVSKTEPLVDYGGGFYGTTLDVSAILGLSGSNLSAEYDITGSVIGVSSSTLNIDRKSPIIEDQLTDIEGGYDHNEMMRILYGAMAGNLSGAGTSTITIKGKDGVTTRIIASVDANGNRTIIFTNAA